VWDEAEEEAAKGDDESIKEGKWSEFMIALPVANRDGKKHTYRLRKE
jgi:hypothetical protein